MGPAVEQLRDNEQPSAALRPRVLLVAGDDAAVVAFHRCISSRATEVELQRARNATEAREMLLLEHELGRTGERLLLLDLDLAEPEEGDALQLLRAEPALREVPIVGFTAEPLPAGEERVGADGLAACLHATGGSADVTADLLVGFVADFLRVQV